MSTVSFIVTVYNKERYLEKVLSSIKRQEGDFSSQYIFIDDGSTDNSLALIRENTRDWPNVTIISEKNQGPSIATNKAIKAATGDYIQFVDGDDILVADSTITLLGAIKNCEVAFGRLGKYSLEQALPISARDKYQTKIYKNPLQLVIEGKARGICSIGATKALVSSALLRRVGGADEKVFTQDFSISLRCALHSDFAYIDKIVACTPLGFASEHLSSSKWQDHHDTLLALYYFLCEYNSEVARYSNSFHYRLNKILFKKLGLEKKMTAYFSAIFFHYLKSKLFPAKISLTELISHYKDALSEFANKDIKKTIYYKI